MSRSEGTLGREYELHRGAVMAMLGKRFPRFDEDERLSIYHDAWARVLAKRERGEEIESLRAYLLATCAAEALNIVTKGRRPTPVAPDEPLFTCLPDEAPTVEERVLVKDQARLARDLIGSLDRRQRDVLKLRWDLQLDGSEVRAALGLSRRQYQRLNEDAATAIAKRVAELADGTWSRKQRSLLTACLVRVSANGDERRGIASERQRREAERLLKTDPHFAALFAEVSGTLRRAAALLPLPLLLPSDGSSASFVFDGAARVRDWFVDLVDGLRQHAVSAYVRAADPTLLASPRPGTVVAALASCVAVGGGAFGAYDAVSKQPTERPAPPAAAFQPPAEPIATTGVPSTATFRRVKRTASRQAQAATEPPPQATPTNPVASTSPPGSPQPVQPSPQPSPPTSEFGFEQ